jgi:hypothetical protein
MTSESRVPAIAHSPPIPIAATNRNAFHSRGPVEIPAGAVATPNRRMESVMVGLRSNR